MALLTVIRGEEHREVPFTAPMLLSDALAMCGIPHHQPCGGHGRCGKCAAEITGCIAPPTDAELRAGTRLTCQTMLLGDASVVLPDTASMQIETGSDAPLPVRDPFPGRYGAAVDIGTTTVVLQLIELSTGRPLSAAAVMNPQTAVAHDVIGRIDAAMHGQGERLRAMVESAVEALLRDACRASGVALQDVSAMVVTGNTTMLYLLTGRDASSLAHAPFAADCLFGCHATLLGIPVYYPPCMHAFVGADVTCAVLASCLTDSHEPALLCDLGTNGETALYAHGKLYVASAAAGPAFEGAGISCGCASIAGAVDCVTVAGGRLHAHTIGGSAPVGLCGSGLIDAVACLLALGEIEPDGSVDDNLLPVTEGVSLAAGDIRAVQLAKAAIAAGAETLLDSASLTADDVAHVYLAGGFGTRLNLHSAAAVGLLPRAWLSRTEALGNAALTGAAMLLTDRSLLGKAEAAASRAVHVDLGGNDLFAEKFMRSMAFPDM